MCGQLKWNLSSILKIYLADKILIRFTRTENPIKKVSFKVSHLIYSILFKCKMFFKNLICLVDLGKICEDMNFISPYILKTNKRLTNYQNIACLLFSIKYSILHLESYSYTPYPRLWGFKFYIFHLLKTVQSRGWLMSRDWDWEAGCNCHGSSHCES